MQQTTLTFYLPGETFERSKITAVKKGGAFTGLALNSVFSLIEQNAYDPGQPAPANDQKATVHLSREAKKSIKRYAAQKGVSVSALFYQALEAYMASEQTNAGRRTKSDSQGTPAIKQAPGEKSTYSIYLTLDNHAKLKQCSAEAEKSLTRLVQDAVLQASSQELANVPAQNPKSKRSSIYVSAEVLELIKKRAEETGLGESELINRALARFKPEE